METAVTASGAVEEVIEGTFSVKVTFVFCVVLLGFSRGWDGFLVVFMLFQVTFSRFF